MNRADLATIRAMFDAFVDPLLLLDCDQKVLRLNGSAKKLFGDAAIGQPARRLLGSPQTLSAIAAAMKGETPEGIELVLPDNIDRTYKVSVQPLYFSDKPGTPRAMVTLHNITDLRRSEQLRVDFLANASHELKTPLASLIGFIETLQGPAKDDTEARERFLAIMHAQASRMSRLVQDLLSLARIEFSEHVVPTGEADMAALTRQAIDQLQPRAAERRVKLLLKPIRQKIPPITGEADQLMQVLQNLIENAIKYTHEDTPVEVSLRRESEAIRLTIRDHGPGIAPEHLPRLTERFYRVDAGRSRHMGGTGLGLSIVKHIINRHRGHLHIESEPGQGSSFDVILPITLE
jgi:two-component system, OmpR family, phosphate regulon sensor histidine kinase PhoR